MSYIFIRQPKNQAIAVILAILFGPLGLLYATISGGLTMIAINVCVIFLWIFSTVAGLFNSSLGLIAGSFGLGFLWILIGNIVCVIWAINAVEEYNQQLSDEIRTLESSGNQVQALNGFGVQHFVRATTTNSNPVITAQNSEMPSFNEWKLKNPGQTLNDYYKAFGAFNRG